MRQVDEELLLPGDLLAQPGQVQSSHLGGQELVSGADDVFVLNQGLLVLVPADYQLDRVVFVSLDGAVQLCDSFIQREYLVRNLKEKYEVLNMI